jgi:hypothetical protein
VNIQIILNLAGMSDDSDLEEVARVMRVCACEWLDLDRHPQDLTVEVSDASIHSERPAFGRQGCEG